MAHSERYEHGLVHRLSDEDCLLGIANHPTITPHILACDTQLSFVCCDLAA